MRCLRIGSEKERVVIYGFLSQIKMHEHCDRDSLAILFDVDKVGWYEVEGRSIELELRLEILR